MAINLPTLPRGTSVTARLLSFGGRLTPPLGGQVQTIARLGSRHAVAIQLPALSAACGAAWLAARLKAEAELDVLRLVWPQPDLGVTANATVGAGGQAGARLAVSGGPALPAGAFFSFTAGGRSYLHSVTEAHAAGAGALSIAPMLRVSPPAGATLNFLAPVIEGDADLGVDWEHQLRRYTTLGFTLTERA